MGEKPPPYNGDSNGTNAQSIAGSVADWLSHAGATAGSSRPASVAGSSRPASVAGSSRPASVAGSSTGRPASVADSSIGLPPRVEKMATYDKNKANDWSSNSDDKAGGSSNFCVNALFCSCCTRFSCCN